MEINVVNIEKNIYSMVLMAVFVSFLGFCVENIWLALTKGIIDNRNMTFPFLLGYGVAIVGLFLIFGTPENIVFFGRKPLKLDKKRRYMMYMLIAFLIVCIGEIILGKLTEKFFGFEYWNYSALPLHITKYTSVFTSFGFAIIITFFMGKCFDPLFMVISSIPIEIAKTAAEAFSALLIMDFIVSFRKMHQTGKLNILWCKEINQQNKRLRITG